MVELISPLLLACNLYSLILGWKQMIQLDKKSQQDSIEMVSHSKFGFSSTSVQEKFCLQQL